MSLSAVATDKASLRGEGRGRQEDGRACCFACSPLQEGAYERAQTSRNNWSSGPLTMVLMTSRLSEAQGCRPAKLAGLLPWPFRKKRVNIVERNYQQLLEELKLSNSDLADP